MFNTFDLAGNGTLGFTFDSTFTPPRTPLDWNNIINQGFAIGSQIIGAFGRNPTTQIGYNPATGGIFAIGGQQQVPPYQNPYAGLTADQVRQLQGGVGSTVGGGIDGIVNWLLANPVITFGGIAALYLLFREPPRRR